MVLHEQSFVEALGRGEKTALRRFYTDLRDSADDAEFWGYLTGLLPTGIAKGEGEGVAALKQHLRASGYEIFIKSAPIHVVVLFFAMAMLFSACSSPEAPVTAAPLEPAPVAAGTTAAVPATGSAAAAPDEAPGPEPDVEKMTADEMRAQLFAYITKAELPASEKRRLKRVLEQAREKKLVESRGDLAALFATKEPAEIAAALEAMVLFQQSRPSRPKMVTKYKGVDFSES